MSKLISGKEALIALANGEDVEYYKHEWMDVNRLSVRDLTSSDNMYKFRLKPRTITLNGIEVPAPFEPKAGDMIWCLNELSKKGYEARTTYDSDDFIAHIAYWRTEEEIKQVVGALRSIFK